MTDNTPRNRLESYARPAFANQVHVQALAALYIGDGLREIAQALNGVANPAKVFRGICYDCCYFDADPDSELGICEAPGPLLSTSATTSCWRLVPTSPNLDKVEDTKTCCPKCQSENLTSYRRGIWHCPDCDFEGPSSLFYRRNQD